MVSEKHGFILWLCILVCARAGKFCYYNGSSLPSLHKECYSRSIFSACYLKKMSNTTSLDPDCVDNDHLNKIRICGGTLPQWVLESEVCYWINDGKLFRCGKPGGHFYNARVFLATEQVDVGGLNLKTELWQNMMDNIGSFGIENSNTLKTHGPGCWKALSVNEGLNNNDVKIIERGVWGTLNNEHNYSHPVMMTEDEVGQWLVSAASSALDGIKTLNSYRTYYDCETSGLGMNQATACRGMNCAGAVQEGCGWKDELTGEKSPKCPDLCANNKPCSRSVPGYKLPQRILAQLYDLDVPTPHYLEIEFEAKQQSESCDIPERLMTILPGFIPELPVEVSALVVAPISLDCAIKFHVPPPDATVHLLSSA